jgi:hypothetical protein
MKTLEQVAAKFAELANRNISTPGLKTYAVDTGKLRDTVKSYNSIEKMITKRPSLSKTKQQAPDAAVVGFQFAPPGATYGKWVEMGTRNMKARKFAGDASKDPELTQTIHEYQADIAAQLGLQAAQTINGKVKNAQLKASKA